MTTAEAAVFLLVDDRLDHGGNGFHLFHGGVVGDADGIEHAPLLHFGEVLNGFSRQRAVVDHHQLAAGAAQMGGAHADFFHRGRRGPRADELTDGERFVEKDHQVSEQLLRRFFEGQADADAAGAEQAPDHRHLHAQTLKKHQDSHAPHQSPQQGQQAFKQLLKVLATGASRGAGEKACTHAIGEAHQHDRDQGAQGDAIGRLDVVGKVEINFREHQHGDQTDRNHGIRQGCEYKVVEIAVGFLRQPGKHAPQQIRERQGDGCATEDRPEEMAQVHRRSTAIGKNSAVPCRRLQGACIKFG